MWIQAFLIAFAIFAAARVVVQHRRQKMSSGWLWTWVVFWLVVIVVVLMPSLTDMAATALGVGRGADLVVYVSLAVLFYSLFRLAMRQEQHNRELTELVRKMAIRQVEKLNTKFENLNKN